MSRKVVVIYSSFRKNGNSELLADEFVKGAEEAGNMVQRIYLRDLRYGFCRGCMSCQKTMKCVQKDDIVNVIDSVAQSDVLVFVTPVYYYAASGQLVTFMDRMNPIYASGHKFNTVYLIATAGEEENYVPEGTVSDIQGWVDCFDGVAFPRTLFCGGVNAVGDIKNKPESLAEAYELGKSIA